MPFPKPSPKAFCKHLAPFIPPFPSYMRHLFNTFLPNPSSKPPFYPPPFTRTAPGIDCDLCIGDETTAFKATFLRHLSTVSEGFDNV